MHRYHSEDAFTLPEPGGTTPPSHDRNRPNASGWQPFRASQQQRSGDHDGMPSSRFASTAPNTKNAGRSAAWPEKFQRRRSASIRQRPSDTPPSHYETARTTLTRRRQSIAPNRGGMPVETLRRIRKPMPNTDRNTSPPSPATQMRVMSPAWKSRDTPPPYGGFAGIPTNAAEPNIIVFVPRPPSTRGRLAQPSTGTSPSRAPPQVAPGSGALSPPFNSPPVPSLFENYREQPSQEWGKIPFTRVYLLCCVVMATFIVPFGTIFLSYVTTHSGITPAAPNSRTFNYRLPLPPTEPSMSTSPPPSAACVKRVGLDDVHSALNVTGRPYTRSGSRFGNLFCIYNNSRVMKGPDRHFIPADLPLDSCTNIIYWSLGLKNGTVESRRPAFDRTQGLSMLRQITGAKGNSDSLILAAIGGYPEDSPEFSLLGRDPGAMSRFAASSVDVVKTHRLNGTAIHWVAPDSRCQDPHDKDTLLHIVAVQRHIFKINGYHAVIAVFLSPTSASNRSLLSELEPFVDYVFVETQALGLPPSGFNLSVCEVLSQRASALLRNLTSPPSNTTKICAGVSIAPWLVEGNPRQHFENLSASVAAKFPGAPGTASVFELCDSSICKVTIPGVQQCIAVTQRSLYDPWSKIPIYLFLDETMLQNITTAGGPGQNDTCVVLYDIDLDSYDRPCDSISEWLGLSHFEISLPGSVPPSVFRKVEMCSRTALSLS